MSKNIKKISLFFVLFFVIVLTSCKNNDNYNNKNLIKIGVNVSLTGVNSYIGESELDGIRFANDIYNTIDIGGVKYKIKLVEVDNKSDTNADTVVKKLLNENVLFVLNGYDDNILINSVDMLEKEKILTINFASNNHDLYNGKKYILNLCPDDTFIASIMANIVKNAGVNNAIIISEIDDKNNKNLNKYLKRAFEGFSIEILDDVILPKNTNNYKDIINGIKEKNPEYIILNTTNKNSAIVIKYIRDASINCKVLSKDFWEYNELLDKSQSSCEDVDFISYFDKTYMPNIACEKFIYGDGNIKGIVDYLKEANKYEYVYSHSALSFDSYMLLYNAMMNTNSFDKDVLIKYICENEYNGVIGDVNFDESKCANIDSIMIKNIENGIPKYKESLNINKH